MARRRAAIEARVGIRDVVAHRAFADIGFRVANRVGKRHRVFRLRAQQKKREPLRRFLADAGQMFQFVDQTRNRREQNQAFDSCLQEGSN